MNLWRKVLLRTFAALWPRGDAAPPTSVGSCGNRQWQRFMSGPVEITITYRDTRRPDGYSREELVEMLKAIRTQEAQMGWKVPEPNGPPVVVTPKLAIDMVKAARSLLEEAYPAYCRARPVSAVSVTAWNDLVRAMDALRNTLDGGGR